MFKSFIKLILIVFFVCIPLHAVFAINDATIGLFPQQIEIPQNEQFSVDVLVSSPNQEINAVSGSLSFASDELEVIAISTSNSIVNFWIQQPTFSNIAGSISYEGILLSPTFRGENGALFTITFKAKKVGASSVNITTASVLANDGDGTNILSSIFNGTYNISGDEPIETKPDTDQDTIIIDNNSDSKDQPKPILDPNLPPLPQVESLSHPNPKKWYKDNDIEIEWELPKGIIGISAEIDQSSFTIPSRVSNTSVRESSFKTNLEDGNWFFHIRFQNTNGWGPTSHFPINIDTKIPKSEIKLIEREDKTNPIVSFDLNTQDDLSGIKRSLLLIDGFDPISFFAEKEMISTPILPPGLHTISFLISDEASNTFEDEFLVQVNELNPPLFNKIETDLEKDSLVVLRGSSYANSEIVITLEGERILNFSTNTDEDGDFVFIIPVSLSSGDWLVSAKVIDFRGATSKYSKPEGFRIQRHFLSEIISFENTSIFFIIIISLVYLFSLFFLVKKPKNKDYIVKDNKINKKALSILKETINSRIDSLEKKKTLSKKEQIYLKELKKRKIRIDLLKDSMS